MMEHPTVGKICLINIAHYDCLYSREDIAKNFKAQGNDYFKGKRYREALGFYSQGVDAKPTEVSLQEALLINRAACNLELS
jgi:hypothetical protein